MWTPYRTFNRVVLGVGLGVGILVGGCYPTSGKNTANKPDNTPSIDFTVSEKQALYDSLAKEEEHIDELRQRVFDYRAKHAVNERELRLIDQQMNRIERGYMGVVKSANDQISHGDKRVSELADQIGTSLLPEEPNPKNSEGP